MNENIGQFSYVEIIIPRVMMYGFCINITRMTAQKLEENM